jgi:hypothetical protein
MLLNKNLSSVFAKLPLINSGLMIGLGIAFFASNSLLAFSLESSRLVREPLITEFFSLELAQNSRSNSPLADGIYLYGQSSQPEQIGQEYLVFKVKKGQVIGAFYMPRSEFSCFYGTIDSRQMNLSIVDPYDHTTSSYSIALRELSPVATGSNITHGVGLEGYQQVKKLGDNDRKILDVCLKDFNEFFERK